MFKCRIFANESEIHPVTMPFFQELNPAAGVRAGIWNITEPADELLAHIHLGDAEKTRVASFRNDLRKRQWLAYRALLQHLLYPLPCAISYDLNGKPFLDSGSHHISVSHAGEFAAAVISETRFVGIDIEKMKDRIERVKERFLGTSEMESVVQEDHLRQLYIYWCGKEALYKLQGTPHVDFRNDIYIPPFDYLCHTNKQCRATMHINGRTMEYMLDYRVIGEYMVVVAF
jgi:4'-phosphopantetheinyl transferase